MNTTLTFLQAASLEPFLDVHNPTHQIQTLTNGIHIAVIPSPQEERRVAGIKESGRRKVKEEDEQLAAALWNLCLCLLYHDPQVVDNVLGDLLCVDQEYHHLMCGGMGEGVKELLHAALGLDSCQLVQH